MPDKIRGAGHLMRIALKAEGLTPGGRLNLAGMTLVFVLTVGSGVLDVVQAVVRIWDPNYTTGLPSFLWVLATFGALLMVCVLIIVLLEPRLNEPMQRG